MLSDRPFDAHAIRGLACCHMNTGGFSNWCVGPLDSRHLAAAGLGMDSTQALLAMQQILRIYLAATPKSIFPDIPSPNRSETRSSLSVLR